MIKKDVEKAFLKFNKGNRPQGYRTPRSWYVLDENGSQFPAKAIYALATNSRLADFNTIDARQALEELGYKIVNKSEDQSTRGRARQVATPNDLVVTPSIPSIVSEMLRYIPCPSFETRSKVPDFSEWTSLSPESGKLFKEDPNAFLFGAIFDFQIDADKAWEVPHQLKIKLKTLDINSIINKPKEDLAQEIGGLHRFRNVMAKRLKSCANTLKDRYQGNASNIWNNQNASEVIRRLLEFEGIGQKIANMFVRMLVTYYGVEINGWNKIDIAVDRHVARVFLRLGLVFQNSRNATFRISDIRLPIIDKARELSPNYPAALDEPAFFIGRNWCTANHAYCEDGVEPCPLKEVCQKRIDLNVG